VFAIAITLLVLEISVPTETGDDLLGDGRTRSCSCVAAVQCPASTFFTTATTVATTRIDAA